MRTWFLHALIAAIMALCLHGAPGQRHAPTRHGPFVHHLMAWITGYTWTGNRTATGVWPVVGVTVATDPSVIPLGSHMTIAGLPGVRVAQDRGGAVVGAHVDVFVSSTAAAYAITGYRSVAWWR